MVDLIGKKYVIVDFQWYRFNKNILVPKELATCDSDFKRSHFVFKPVTSFGVLTEENQRVARYVYSYHHGLKWEDGYVAAGDFDEIVKRLCMGADLVFVKGREKLEFLKSIIDTKIVDLVYADKIRRAEPGCGFHVGDEVVCALSVVERLFTYLEGGIEKRFKSINYI